MREIDATGATSLSSAAILSGRDHVIAQMKWIREYTLQLIESVPHDLWYVRPAGAVTHVAWQVGHLAVAQYGLMLFRQRGRVEIDLELMPGWLRKNFGRGSQAQERAEGAPAPADLLQHMQAIHAQAMLEVPLLTETTLAEATEMPYTAYPIKLGALMFCPLHESIHAGQIGLLRRLHGLDPIR